MSRNSRSALRQAVKHVAVVVGSVGLLGVGIADGVGPDPNPGGPSPVTSARLPSSVATIPWSAAVARIRTPGRVPDLVSLAQMSSVPPEIRGTNNGPWFDAVIRARSVGDGGNARALWQGWLVSGALGDLVGRGPRVGDVVGGVRIHETLPEGGTVVDDAGGGAMPSRQSFNDDPTPQIERRIREIAPQFGFSVVNVTVVRAYTAAPMVVLRTDDLQNLGHTAPLIDALFSPWTEQRYEGHFIEFQDSVGRVLAMTFQSGRVGIGGTWTDPSVDGIIDWVHGGRVVRGPVSKVQFGLRGVRWATRGGRRQGLVVRLKARSATSVRVNAFSRRTLIARGRVSFSGDGIKTVRLRMVGHRADRLVRRGTEIEVRASGEDLAGNAGGLVQAIVPRG